MAEVLLDLEGNVIEEVRIFAGSRQSVTSTLLFTIAGVFSGRALIRVVIDGVQSALELGPDNRYDRPSVAIP